MADAEKRDNSSSVEKGAAEDEVEVSHEHLAPTSTSNPNYRFDVHDIDRVQRRLKQRHVQMYVILFSICFKPSHRRCRCQDRRESFEPISISTLRPLC